LVNLGWVREVQEESVRTLSVDRIRDVAENVLREAVHQGLGAGSRLPTERALAEKLRITRSAVRNAMSLLESDGVISREVGRGTYLKSDPLSALVDLDSDDFTAHEMLNDIGPADVMAARQAFEPMAMYLAVVEATEADLEVIQQNVEGCARAAGYDEFEVCDLAFHRSLMEATHNPLLLRMYSLIEAARQGDLWGSMKRRGDTPERRHRSFIQHAAIADALRNRDGRAAQEAMSEHLEFVSAYLRQNTRR